ncbi:hypothetical protein DFH06DRAFT_1344041 [Mycena polygramma]|nr:hypothetical protein DFH06DRAFT_1344041 [Mycena polygramma]
MPGQEEAPENPWVFGYSGDSDDPYDGNSGDEEEYEKEPDNEEELTDDDNDDGLPPESQHNPPTIEEARKALADLRLLLRPPRKTGKGYKDPKLDLFTRTWLEWLSSFLHMYCDDKRPIGAQDPKAARWTAASLEAAYAAQKGSALEDEDVASEIALHLQSIGKYVKALDIVHYIDGLPELKKKIGRKKGISLATAQRWMRRMGYRWTKNPSDQTKNLSGQFVDGHERADVTRKWALNNLDLIRAFPENQVIVVWFHDESTFYANDCRLIRWVHSSETAVPRAKGEGASMMAVDFISADYGWLRSKDGKEGMRVLFKAGKNREGYFTNEDVVKQTRHAMDILERDYPDEKHVFIFDNATTHTKRADDALSARNMPKFTPKEGKENWLLTVNKLDASGKQVYNSAGKLVKTKVPMRDGVKPNGDAHPFYFPPPVIRVQRDSFDLSRPFARRSRLAPAPPAPRASHPARASRLARLPELPRWPSLPFHVESAPPALFDALPRVISASRCGHHRILLPARPFLTSFAPPFRSSPFPQPLSKSPRKP